MNVRGASLLVLLGASSCVVWYGVDYLPSAHVKKILAREGTSGQLSGRITSAFEPARGGELAKAENKNFALAYLGIKDGTICFYAAANAAALDSDVSGRKHADAFVRKSFESKTFVFEARRSLDGLTEWPSDPPTQVESLDISVRGQKKVFDVYGRDEENRGKIVSYDVVLCGPAPRIEPESKYLTVMRMPKKQMAGLGGEPSLLVWIVDRAAEPAVDPRTAPESTAATAAPAPVVEKDLRGVLTKDGRFGTFLAALTTAGLEQALTSKEPLTIFAPTDAAFNALGEAKRKALLANPTRLKDVLQNHLIVGAYQATMFGTAARPSRLKTLHGKTVRVRDEKGQIFIENRRVSTADISADGGIIHVIDGLVEL